MNIADDEVLSLLKSLNRHKVQFLLVGGMAGVVHGHIRTTQDMDLWLKSDAETKASLILALKENNVVGADYLKDVPLLFGWTTVAVGKYGFTLDMGYQLKAFRDVDFEVCYERAIDIVFDEVPFKVIQLNDLITEKLATGRPKDLNDVDELIKIKKDRNAD
ncbi:nucleotidyltransferase [Spirosoma sp.]|uniref:nucleotidyltransferase n=1 Tax=Spirosoma sp. TaxID=1899569 RepID=UPI002625A692|nr:nucleotidyltransferase [Spirosoma sp.]MCX6219330.1 nucleotidyltransferase [Spirosoma sp.]